MSNKSRGRKNNISTMSRIKCFLDALGDKKQSLNPKYANSNSKIKF